MNDYYYTNRNYIKNEDYSNNYYTPRIIQNDVFRNFLINEKKDNTQKRFYPPRKKEILPNYKNIKSIITNYRTEINTKFDIKDTLFKEIQKSDLRTYSEFAKNFSEYYFGPNGYITKNNPELKKFHKHKERQRKKINLTTKIYAGRWQYLEENPNYKSYLARLKNSRRQILNIGGNFSTEDDFTQKLHDIFLRGSKKPFRKNENKEEKNKENNSTQNIFEYTSIGTFKKNSRKKINKINKNKISLNISPNNLIKKIRDDNNNSIIRNKNKTLSNYHPKNKIKNIFLKEHLIKKENLQKKKYFSNLKLSIKSKINSLNNPVKKMRNEIFLIKKKNETFYNFREDKDKYKYKEDIKVIGEDDQRETDEFMEKFVKKVFRQNIQDKGNTNPRKIFFTYFENGNNTVRESLKNFVRGIGKIKEEERKLRYEKTIREQFKSNWKTIGKLAKELDDLKIKSKLNFESKG